MSAAAVRDHCGDRFVSGRLSLSPTGSMVTQQTQGVTASTTQVRLSPTVPVMEYQFWLFDAGLAQAGQAALQAAENELTSRAAKQQRDSTQALKPKL
jgi:hypothetical protein